MNDHKTTTMKQLNKTQSILMVLGALLMVIGVALRVFNLFSGAAWLFAIGAITFATMQMLQSYDGDSLTLRRLRRILTFGDVCFILSALLMVENTYLWLMPLFSSWWEKGYFYYLTYVYNNWVVLLLVGALLELYATHRISNEIEKEAKKR